MHFLFACFINAIVERNTREFFNKLEHYKLALSILYDTHTYVLSHIFLEIHEP